MARHISADRELDDMTECSICTEVFTDPRVLPCIHTFCLKCLLNYGKDRQPGDAMPCPLCRKMFSIPKNGFAGMQKNFLVEKLLHVRKQSTRKEEAHSVVCDACRTDEPSSDEIAKPATMHCVQCQQNYCDQCSRSHTRMKATTSHVQIEIGKGLQEEQVVLPPAACETHEGEEIKMLCLECNVAICMICHNTSHKNHNYSDIKKMSAHLCSQVRGDGNKATEELKKTGELLRKFYEKQDELMKKLSDAESEINKTADYFIDTIQRDRKKLLSEVNTIRQKRFKELESAKEELEQHMAALESFRKYAETLLSSGTACDVTRSAKSLHDRADELTTFDISSHVRSCLEPFTFKFRPTPLATGLFDRETGNFVGSLSEDEKAATPIVRRVTAKADEVSGVAVLGDLVFVMRYSVQGVEVYDADTLTLQRRINVSGVESYSAGLAACAVYNCLYMLDFLNNSVHRVELLGSNTARKWSVAKHSVGLSVNSSQNLLVVSQGERKLQEFTTRGSLVRNIQLQPDIERPESAVQLSADTFLVSHTGSLHFLCVVDGNGSVVRTFKGPLSSDIKKTTHPAGLAVDKHGNVVVADELNNRLLVLDQSLSSACEMSVSVDGGLQQPYTLCYDESRGRLYVGEYKGGRVVSLDNLKTFLI